MSDANMTKAVVSVTEMARMVGLSRARFYQLVRSGTFPSPDTEPTTQRPFYGQEKQVTVLEVRRRNCGIDGKPILFYSRRRNIGTVKRKSPKPKVEPKGKDVTSLVDGLNALGLTTATAAKVQQVIEELYPNGTAEIDQGEVLKAVFLEIRRRNSSGSGGDK